MKPHAEMFVLEQAMATCHAHEEGLSDALADKEASITMRLTGQQAQAIHELAIELAGNHARVWLFGSRLDDAARGGDCDLMLELTEPMDNPALLAARFSAKASRLMHGRKVDVLLSSPNLMRLPIHEIVFKEGKLL